MRDRGWVFSPNGKSGYWKLSPGYIHVLFLSVGWHLVPSLQWIALIFSACIRVPNSIGESTAGCLEQMIFKGPFQAKPFHDAVMKPSTLLTYLLSEVNRLVYRQICEWNNTHYLLIDLLMNQENWNETEQWNLLMTTQGNKLHNGTYKEIIYIQKYSHFKLVILYINHTTERQFSIQHIHEFNFLKELLINEK